MWCTGDIDDLLSCSHYPLHRLMAGELGRDAHDHPSVEYNADTDIWAQCGYVYTIKQQQQFTETADECRIASVL